jgi:hypothetical protein
MQEQMNGNDARQEVKDEILAVTQPGQFREQLLKRLSTLSGAWVRNVVWYILSMNESEKWVNAWMLERFIQSSAHIQDTHSVEDQELEAA